MAVATISITGDGNAQAFMRKVAEEAKQLGLAVEGTGKKAKPAATAFENYQKELKKAERTMRDLGVSGGQIGTTFGALANPLTIVGGLLASAGAAAVLLSAKLLETAGRLSDLSGKTGISAEGLQRLELPAKLAGVSLDTLAGAAVELNKRLSQSPQSFEKWGVSAERLRAIGPEKALTEIAERLQRIPDQAARTAAAMDMLGKGGAELLPAVEALAEMGDKAEALGLVLDNETIEAVDELGDQIDILTLAIERALLKLVAMTMESPILAGALESAARGVGILSNAMDEMEKRRVPFAAALGSVLASGGQSTGPKGGLTGMTEIAGMAPEAYSKAWDEAQKAANKVLAKIQEDQARAAEKSRAAWQKAAEDARKAWDKMHADLAKMARESAQGIQAMMDKRAKGAAPSAGPLVGLTRDEALTRLLADAGAFDAKGGRGPSEGLRDAAADWDRMLKERTEADRELFAAFIDSTLGLVGALANIGAGFRAATNSDSGLQRALGGAAFGSQLGGQIGAMVPIPGGAALGRIGGAVIGGIAGLFGDGGKKKREAEEARRLQEEMNSLRTSFLESAGGLDELRARADAAGVSLEGLFEAKTAAELEATIGRIRGQLEEWGEANRKVGEAMDRWGITIEEMGPKFRQQELDKQSLALLEDWKLLHAAGVDITVLADKMGPALVEHFQMAAKTGATLPSAMRPIYEELLAQGKLVDENGKAYESLEDAGVSFADTMEESMQRAVDQIERLVNALLGVPNNIETNVYVKTHGAVPGAPGMPGDPSGPDGEGIPQNAVGGWYGPRPGGHVVRVAEAGQGEYVLTEGQMRAKGGGQGGGVNVAPGAVQFGDIHAPAGADPVAFAEELGRQVERGMAQALVTALNRARV